MCDAAFPAAYFDDPDRAIRRLRRRATTKDKTILISRACRLIAQVFELPRTGFASRRPIMVKIY